MILVTGNNGYIGAVMTRVLQERSYEVLGIDNNYFEGCELYSSEQPYKQIVKDIRDINEKDLEGVEAIIHLAALSNDPLGEINPPATHEINYIASVKLAELAKNLGVSRYIFSSSCSLYGIASGEETLTEEGRLDPVTAYAKSKVGTEREISKLADDGFHPIFMRNPTVYGVSPNMRLDLVVNNLTASAVTTGKVSIKSDGTPWRPIVHVEDLCNAFLAALEAPVDKIHNEAFNVGINEENYQVKGIGEEVEKIVPDCSLEILNETGPGERTYRVDFSKINEWLPQFKPKWNLKKGIEELSQVYRDFELSEEDLKSLKFFKVKWMKYLMESGKLDENFRWIGE